jgi:hypothetical protein
MVKVIYPITWSAGREGEVADVIHDIAEEMLEHRADLLRNAGGPQDDCQVYLKQARFLEKYANVLDAIYFQLEPERWNPETSAELLTLAQSYQVDLPGWMLPDRMKPRKMQEDEPFQETPDDAQSRFDNEGGRIPPAVLDIPARN